MKKQIILTALTLLFVLLVCNAVSAASDNCTNVVISGEVLKCSNGEPFPNVTVTASKEGVELASATTKEDGTYNLNFVSTDNIFTVTASYPKHNSSSKEVTVSPDQNNTIYGTANFQLGVDNTYVNNSWIGLPAGMIVIVPGDPPHIIGIDAFATIEDGINNTNPDGTVHIASGQYSGAGNTGITIAKNITIQGQSQNGTIINGIGRKFTVTSGVNVILKNLTLTNGTAPEDAGGAICNYGNLTVENCTFTSNNATFMGGAIYNKGNLTMENCTFINNTSYSAGGAIYNENGNLTADHCTFINNIAPGGGAIMNVCYDYGGSISMDCTLTGCTFTNNTAISMGGAISNDRHNDTNICNVDCTITGSTFTGNNATWGGAIYCSDVLNVNNCTFTSNNASAGGAILTFGSSLIANSNFDNNIANTEVPGDFIGGGAILSIMSNCTIINSTFNNNQAMNSLSGGAILNKQGNLTITSSNLTSNSAIWGGAIFNDGNLTADYCTFTSNLAYTIGGAIYNLGNLTAENCTFTSNNAFYGGAISNYCNVNTGNNVSVVCSLTNCTFTSNTVWTNGGAIHNYCNVFDGSGIVDCTITNCTFTGNTATSFGGAISNECIVLGIYGNVDCTIINNTFTSNTASKGGAIYNYNNCIGGFAIMDCTVNGSTFTGNTASSFGGAIHNYCGVPGYSFMNSLKANFNRFYGNQAPTGSAIYNDGGSVDAENNWWSSNIPTWGNLISGFVQPAKWVILTVNATPNTINNTQTSTVTADFNHINGGGDLVGGHIPNGPIALSIPWGSFIGSSIPHFFQANTVAGVITATFFANEGSTPSVNPVTVTASADGYTTTDTESAKIYINQYTNLTVTKTGPTTVIAGNQISYTITVTNNGPDPAVNVQIVDNIPAILQGVTYDPFSLGTIPVGESRTIQINGTVPSSALFGTIIENSATVTSDTLGTITPSDTVSTTVNTQYEVIINKIVNKSRPNVGETVTFTVIAHNNGPSDALNIQIQDLMPADFTDVTITPSKGIYDAGTGIWTLGLTNGEEATLNLTGKVSAIMAGKNTTNTVSYGSNSVNATIYIPKSDLYIKLTSSNKNPKAGETFTLTYKLGNNGPDSAENVTITIPLPKGFELGNINGDGDWTYDAATRTITWTLENVPIGDPYLYVSGRFTNAGTYVFDASISSDTYTINTEDITPLKVNAVEVANAATVGMQQTGLPIAGLILAVLALFGGLALSKRK